VIFEAEEGKEVNVEGQREAIDADCPQQPLRISCGTCMMRKRPNTANNVPMGRISRPVRSLVKRATASATVRASPTSSLVKVVLSARTGINESGSKIAPVLSPSFQSMYDAICDSDFSRAGKPVTSIAVEANARTSWKESAHLARRSRLSYSVIESGIFHLNTRAIAGGSDITRFFAFRRKTKSRPGMPSTQRRDRSFRLPYRLQR
jgi:hypothetical protein